MYFSTLQFYIIETCVSFYELKLLSEENFIILTLDIFKVKFKELAENFQALLVFIHLSFKLCFYMHLCCNILDFLF